MIILIFLGIPLLVWVVLMVLSLPRLLETEEDRAKVSEQVNLPPPRFARDYTGQLWVERGSRGFFRRINRRAVPPDQTEE